MIGVSILLLTGYLYCWKK